MEAGAPHVQEGEGTGVPKEKEKDQGSVGERRGNSHMKRLRGKPCNPGKKSRLLHHCHCTHFVIAHPGCSWAYISQAHPVAGRRFSALIHSRWST